MLEAQPPTQPSQSPAGSRLPGLGGIGILVAAVAVLLAPVIFNGQILLPMDLAEQTEPWRSAVGGVPGIPHNAIMSDALWEAFPMAVQAQKLWRSGLPLWDPTALIGMPALAAGKMYTNPVFLALATVLTPEQAMSWAAVLHLLIAAIGTYLLLRELGTCVAAAVIGALAFALNGYLLVWLSLTYFTGTMIWTPLLFWGIERALRRRAPRWLALAAGIFALQILAGFVLFAAHSGLLVALVYGPRALVAVWRRRSFAAGHRPATYGALAVVGGVALAAFQFVPAMELFQHADRAGKEYQTVMPVHEMLRVVVPGVTGNPLAGGTYEGAVNYPETTLYFGLVPLLCLFAAIVTGRCTALVFAGCGLVFWLAVYGVTPCFQLVDAITPGFRGTFPGRVFFIVAFSWSVVAGLGADSILRSRTGLDRGHHRALLGAIAGGSTLLVVLRFTRSWWSGAGWPYHHPETVKTAACLLLTCILVLALRFLPGASPNLIGLLLIGLTAGDLIYAHGRWNGSFDASGVLPETTSLTKLLTGEGAPGDSAPPRRIAAIGPDEVLPGMAAQAFGLSNISGYSSWILERYSRYATLTGTRFKAGNANRVLLTACCDRLHDALAVDRVYASDPIPRLDVAGSLLLELGAAHHAGPSAPNVNFPWLRGGRRESLFQHAPSRLTFAQIDATASRFTAALGLDWTRCPSTDGVVFEVRVRTADGKSDSRFKYHLKPDRRRRPTWHPIDVALRPQDGQPITSIVLITHPGPAKHAGCDWALWGQPKIHFDPPAISGLRRMAGKPNPIYKNREALPRARLVHHVISVPAGDFDAVATALDDEGLDLAKTAVVEGTLPSPLGPANARDQANLISFEPHRLSVEVETQHPALLVLAEAFYPGWRARIDGIAAPVMPTNLSLRGVPIPAGRHQVVLIYRPTSFLIGSTISIGTLLFLVGLLIATRPRKRR